MHDAAAARVPASVDALRFADLPPLSLYVHLPWCLRKCPYCDFNSYEARDGLPEQAYVEALLKDLDSELPLVRGRPLESVYLGGGTPSLFSPLAISQLLDGIRKRCALAGDAEITLEANPGAADAARFAGYREAGVTRLSIGVQSFRTAQLRALGRVHDGGEAERAAAAARAAGFDNFNLDLMYGLPQDDVRGALGDLERALAARPTHLSWYQLTLEPNTAFERRPPRLPADDAVAEIEASGRTLLAAAGYERYEISAYALPGKRSAHNLNYWRFGDYVGIGAGAHGKLTDVTCHVIERCMKTRSPRTYVERAGTPAAVQVERIVEPRQAALEFLLNALRLSDGVGEALFTTRAGQSTAGIAAARREAERRGWLVSEPKSLRATPRGLEVLNRLLELFA